MPASCTRLVLKASPPTKKSMVLSPDHPVANSIYQSMTERSRKRCYKLNDLNEKVEMASPKGSSRRKITANMWNAGGGIHYRVGCANRRVLSMHCYLIKIPRK